MRRFRAVWVPAACLVLFALANPGRLSCAFAGGGSDKFWSTKARLDTIKRAQVWKATNVGAMNLRKGPPGADAFAPNQTVTCSYTDDKLSGRTPKFSCALSPTDRAKVKYGAANGEVYAEVAASRLLWALGFGADRMYPVRVICTNCPADPHKSSGDVQPKVVFDPAAIERKLDGHSVEVSENSGWAWPELDLIDAEAGGAPVTHRDALKLLAVFLQHDDTKPSQQRLVCLDEPKDEHCARPLMMLNDLGVTFGRANLFNTNNVGSVNFEKWSETAIWLGDKGCVGNLTASQTGTLDKPVISDAGRRFLGGLLMKLSDAQLRDLFTVARFDQRKSDKVAAATVDDWVAAFKKKRAEIVDRSCSAVESSR